MEGCRRFTDEVGGSGDWPVAERDGGGGGSRQRERERALEVAKAVLGRFRRGRSRLMFRDA